MGVDQYTTSYKVTDNPEFPIFSNGISREGSIDGVNVELKLPPSRRTGKTDIAFSTSECNSAPDVSLNTSNIDPSMAVISSNNGYSMNFTAESTHTYKESI